MRQIEKNIEAAMIDMTIGDRQFGDRAYDTYHEVIRGLALYYNSPFVASVEAFAALSPNNDYHGNLRSLATLLKGRHEGRDIEECVVTTFRSAARRAWSYLDGSVSFLDTVKGRKITAFRHNILYPETSKHVVVDGHMIALALDRKLTMKEANGVLTKKMYDEIERCVVRVARRQLMFVPSVQGALWGYRKRTQGIVFDGQLSMFEEGTRWDRVLKPEEIVPFPFKVLDDRTTNL